MDQNDSELEFSFDLEEGSLHLDEIDAVVLLDYIRELSKAIWLAAGVKPTSKKRPRISLMEIKEGSCKTRIRSDLVRSFRETFHSAAPLTGLDPGSREALEKLQEKLRKNGHWVRVNQVSGPDPEDRVELFRISAERPLPKESRRVESDYRTLYVRVTGYQTHPTPRVSLLIEGAGPVVEARCDGVALARELAEFEKSGKVVGVYGEATWERDSGRLKRFFAKSLTSFREVGLKEALRRLRELDPEAVAKIDPREVSREFRGE